MSDYTESNYTKTGKKVKSIYDGRVDLTYNEVYDVFIDNKGDKFIIDDIGDKRYWSISDDDYYELVDDVAMSDGTKSNYTKTGKKVMCINSNRRDLTYKKVYDVFTNQDSEDFIIDDVGDKRYESLEFPYWCETSDGMVDKANETKPKFKVGDVVKVVDIGYISQYTSDIKVGDVGVITYVDSDHAITPYRVEFDDDYWWFTDKCIELVGDTVDTVNDNNTTDKKYNPLVVQQSGNHYKNGKIQPIEYSERNCLSMCQGNIVKYITRHKEKNGIDDLAKVVHYALLEALFVYGEDGATELRDKIDSLINIENKE